MIDSKADAVYVSESGETMTRRQIAYAVWKRDAEVKSTDGGFTVDGDLFRSID